MAVRKVTSANLTTVTTKPVIEAEPDEKPEYQALWQRIFGLEGAIRSGHTAHIYFVGVPELYDAVTSELMPDQQHLQPHEYLTYSIEDVPIHYMPTVENPASMDTRPKGITEPGVWMENDRGGMRRFSEPEYDALT